jgi:hypothetical protein
MPLCKVRRLSRVSVQARSRSAFCRLSSAWRCSASARSWACLRATLSRSTQLVGAVAGAAVAAAGYPGLHRHAFPTCFVCGPDRSAGDGLRIFAGEVAGEELVASPWKPADGLAGDDGVVHREFAWAALDCPGAWAWLPRLDNPVVLGRLAAVIDQPIFAGQPHIVGGWRMGNEGRKHYSGTVIWRADGTVCARAKATWIEVDAARFSAAGSLTRGFA